MKLSDLLDEFNVVIDTAEGLTELRSLILGLAVRGKLVPQDPIDEPATDLLKKIEAEKERLYEQGEIRKPKKVKSVTDEEVPFEVPSNWVWTKLGKTASDVHYGYTESADFDIHEPKFLRITDIQNGKVDWENTPGCKIDEKDISKYQLHNGDLLIARTGGTVGKSFLISEVEYSAVFASYLIRFIPTFTETSEYIHKYFYTKLYWDQLIESTTGTGQPNVNATKLSDLLFPLPPLAEQHRIVQKIESLFAEVDELEAKLNRQTKLDEKLQLAVNAEVQQAPDAESSKAAWSFITTNFDTLYHTPEAIENLKKNILNEAVRGRLVPQNPNDEPASELLKKIEAEKQRLYEEGEIRKPKKLPPVREVEIPFEIPENWAWVRFGDLASTVEYGTSQKAHEEPIGVPVLRMGNIDENGNMIFDNLKYVNPDINDLPRLYLKNNDLIFNRTNSYELVGKMGLFKDRDKRFTLASYLIRSTLLKDIHPEYIHHYFNSLHCRVNEIEPEITKQTNQANFNGTKLQHVRVPLPAKEEQQRIVQRIEKLFAICDRFKAQLEQREKVNERLVKGLVQEVLEESSGER